MKSTILLLAVFVAALSSCSTAYKTGQTPDDVYYSPGRQRDEYVRTEKQDDRKYKTDEEYYDDRYLRMKVQNHTQWSDLDDWYNYGNRYNYRYYSFNNWNNPWSPNIYWNYYYNPYCKSCCVTTNIKTSVAVNNTPRYFNLNTYNTNSLTTNNYVSSNTKFPSTTYNNIYTGANNNSGSRTSNTYYNTNNNNSNSGNTLRNIFGNSNSSSSSGAVKTNTSSSSSSSSGSSSSGSSPSSAPVRRF